MLSPRFLTSRSLVWIGLALLTAFLVAVCLFWVVFHRPGWIRGLPIGENGEAPDFVARCYRMRLSWPSADANANGAPDWYEESLGMDSRASTPFPQIDVWVMNEYVYNGERTRLRLRLNLLPYSDVRWPRGTEVVITTQHPILLPVESPEGTPPTTGPLHVKLSSQGFLEIDVFSTEPPDAKYDGAVYLTITHARSGLSLTAPKFHTFISCGWRGPARPSHIQRRFLDDFFTLTDEQFGPPEVAPFLVWDEIPGDDVTYILEAARADAPENWIGFDAIRNRGSGVYLLNTVDRRHFPGYEGPLHYRVVPASQDGPWAR